MRVAIILALASLGAVIAGALYARATRDRGQRAALADREAELAESEAQPEPSPDIQQLEPDPHESSVPSFEVETKPERVPVEPPLAQPPPAPVLPPVNIEPIHSDEDKTPEGAWSTAEIENPQGSEPSVKIAFTQEDPPTPDSVEEGDAAMAVSDTLDNNAGFKEQTQPGVDEYSPEGYDRLPRQSESVSPEKRGGRPRATTQEGEPDKTVKTGWRFQKPEIVCWNRAREWILAVELPQDLRDAQGISVSQNSVDLVEDELEKGCWRLAELRGGVVVRAVDHGGMIEFKSPPGEDGHVLFRLSGADLDRGRCVKQPSFGSYVVIAPEDWERCEELAGTAPATPEPVRLEGYRAHFFDLAGNSATSIAFRDRTGHSIVIGSAGPRFKLVGQKVNDASENLGPLFVVQTPSLSIMDGSWEDVGIIVLGEEGHGRGRWRTSLKPNPAMVEQQVREIIAVRKAGWYFVRFYNLEGDLIDSQDFRFAAGLRGIALKETDAFPSVTGHQVTTVDFEHDTDWCVARSCASPGEVNVERTDEKTILTIPPMQDSDRTQWLLGLRGGPQVEVSILVERIWWAASHENRLPNQWTDKQLLVTREDLKASSTMALWLHFPRRRWTNSVTVGFSQATARPYRVLATESTVAVPLRDFGDCPEMDTIGEFSLRLWVSHQETSYDASACKLAVRAGCAFDDFSATTEEEVLLHVKAHHLHALTRALTWEEHRLRIPSLPTRIYRCGYCSIYVRADNSPHPDGAIIRHINDVHAAAVRHPVQIRFRVVNDTEEIRQNVIDNLPRIHRCTLCGSELEDFDEADLWRHSVEKHKSRLLDLR